MTHMARSNQNCAVLSAQKKFTQRKKPLTDFSKRIKVCAQKGGDSAMAKKAAKKTTKKSSAKKTTKKKK